MTFKTPSKVHHHHRLHAETNQTRNSFYSKNARNVKSEFEEREKEKRKEIEIEMVI